LAQHRPVLGVVRVGDLRAQIRDGRVEQCDQLGGLVFVEEQLDDVRVRSATSLSVASDALSVGLWDRVSKCPKS